MAHNGLPQGWSYEPGDPSVGIFGDAFIHEDCALPSDQLTDADQAWTHDSLTLTCPCGATVELEAPEPEVPNDDADYWFPAV